MQCTTGVAVPAGPDRLGGPWSRGPKGTAATSRDTGYNRDLGEGGGEPSCAQRCSSIPRSLPQWVWGGVGCGTNH